MTSPVFNAGGIGAFVLASQSRRVDIAIIGDSNTEKDFGSGHNVGMRLGWASKVGVYSTQLFGMQTNGGYDSGSSAAYAMGTNFTVGSNSGAPSNLEPYNLWNNSYLASIGATGPALGTGIFAQSWQYNPTQGTPYNANSGGSYLTGIIPPGPSNTTSNNKMITHSFPADLTQELIWHWTHATIAGSAGYWNPTAFQGGFYPTMYATTQASTAGGSSTQWVDGSLTVPAGARGATGTQQPGSIRFLGTNGNNSTNGGIKAPVLISYQRVEVPAITSGISLHELLYQGGRCAYDAAKTIQAWSQLQMTEFFRQATRLQNGPPMMLIQIMHGGNDLNQTEISAGPNPQQSGQPGGYADNLAAIIIAMTNFWVGAGNSASNLFFMLGPYHPALSRIADTLVWQGSTYQQLVAYELAQQWVAQHYPNVTAVSGSQMMPGGFSQVANWLSATNSYDYQGDAHLIRHAYSRWGQMAIDSVFSSVAGGRTQTRYAGADGSRGTRVRANGADA